MEILVVGFGPFLDVADNPAATLALAIDGLEARVPPLRVTGREMPVSYARAAEQTQRWARELSADFVLGVGVARARRQPLVERIGRRRADPTLADVDGERLERLAADGPDELACDDAARLAAALDVGLSDDAGAYVCNAWLYRTLSAGTRSAFLHVPPAGFPVARLAAGLRSFALGGMRGST